MFDNFQGYSCQRWDTDYPHHPRAFPLDRNNNFCRNPDNDPKGPWCYTRNPHKRWDYCDVPVCESEVMIHFSFIVDDELN